MFNRRRPRTAAAAPPPSHPAADAVATLTDADFTLGLTGCWTVVDFWAPWCGPCRQFAPRFEHAASTNHGPMRFARCDVDTQRGAAAQVGIVSIPTLGLFDPDGQLRGRLVGVRSGRQLDAFLAQVPHDAASPAE